MMVPVRGNKDKQKIEFNGKTESRSFGESSVYQRVVFSKRITVLVSPSKNVDNFRSLFQISRRTFNYVCLIVREHMMSTATKFVFKDGKSMSLNDQVAIALRRLSSCDSMINIARFFETNHSTVSDVTWRLVKALEDCGGDHLRWPSEMALIKSRFERIGGLPNCCGAIETAHLKMSLPTSERKTDVWLNRENNHSMKLQVIVDPEMRFRDVLTGWPGCMTNDEMLQRSEFFDLAQKGARLNGNEITLPEGTKAREYIVGGSGFQLLPWLITPYQDEELPEDKSEFNKKHLATRLVAKRALKRLKEVWGVIDGAMWRPDMHKFPRIILACCILHNILIDMEGNEVLDESTVSYEDDPGSLPEVCALANKDAEFVRDKLSLYLAGRPPA